MSKEDDTAKEGQRVPDLKIRKGVEDALIRAYREVFRAGSASSRSIASKPKIFIPIEDDLIEVLVEEYEDFCIYWFHWPRDGVYLEQDYEPIIVIFKDDKIACAITRRHWEYQDHKASDGLVVPLEAIFDGMFHPPYVKDINDEDYESKKKSLIPREYKILRTESSIIPPRFRIGEGHLSWELLKIEITMRGRRPIAIKDPRIYAEEYIRDHLNEDDF